MAAPSVFDTPPPAKIDYDANQREIYLGNWPANQPVNLATASCRVTKINYNADGTISGYQTTANWGTFGDVWNSRASLVYL